MINEVSLKDNYTELGNGESSHIREFTTGMHPYKVVGPMHASALRSLPWSSPNKLDTTAYIWCEHRYLCTAICQHNML